MNPYAASKAAAELVGLHAHLGRGLDVIRARPFNHTGPGQLSRYVVPALARQVAVVVKTGGGPIYTGNLQVRRDFADVRDVVKAYRLLVERGDPGQVYNVCTGRSVLLQDVAERLIGLAGTDLVLRVDPARLRPSDVPEMRGDFSRLQKATGWEPLIDLDETLQDVLTYWTSEVATSA
jgi:GDP-4-dehydro-6-deoxy-D-mannose reductase